MISFISHPFTDPAVIPPTICFWVRIKIKITGSEDMVAVAIRPPQSVPCWPINVLIPTVIGQYDLSGNITSAKINSPQANINPNAAQVTSAGRVNGIIIFKNVPQAEHPSIRAASSNACEISKNEVLKTKTINGNEDVILAIIIPK